MKPQKHEEESFPKENNLIRSVASWVDQQRKPAILPFLRVFVP
jgi:hypothetical protein